MRGKRIAAFVMALFMALSLFPAAVFASELILLEGELKFPKDIAVGDVLRADYEKVIPYGITDDDVSFLWSRKTPDDEYLEEIGEFVELKELSKEKTYEVKPEDLGNKIVLTVTGLEERGFSGSLTVTSTTVIEMHVEDIAMMDNMETIEDVSVEEETLTEDIPPEEILEEEWYPDEGYDENTLDPDEEWYSEEEWYTEEDFSEEEWYTEEDYTEDGSVEDDSWMENVTVEEVVFEMPEEAPVEENLPATEEVPVEETVPEALTYTAEAYAGENGVLDFGVIVSGSESMAGSQFVTVINTGTGTLNFEGISPEHFMVQDIVEPLLPGNSVDLWIVPREGTVPGAYEDIISYSSLEGAAASFTAKVVIEAVPDENTNIVYDEEVYDAGELTPVEDLNQEGDLVPIEGEDSETTPEVTPEITPEITPETTPEVTPEITPEVTPEITPEVTPEITPEPAPAPIVGIDTNAVDFGSKREGYEQAPDAAVITIANAPENSSDVALTAPISDHGVSNFTVSAYITTEGTELPDNILPVGNGVYFTVQPNLGLPQGTYEETFSIYNAVEDAEVRSPLLTFTVSFTVAEPVYHSLVISASELNFGNAEVGYSGISAQQVTVTNNGNATEVLNAVSAANYTVTDANGVGMELAPGVSITFNVVPKNGFGTGTYDEVIYIASANASVQFTASFSVSDTTPVLVGIRQPNAVAGLANGTKKDAAALKLPASVVIETTQGYARARVSWDVAGCAYNPNNTAEQTFTVKGNVTLPEGVKNTNNVSLTTAIKVNVKGYSAKLASAEDNKISGLTIDKNYSAQARISFTAIGAGMDNNSPSKGDTRFVPYTWTVINTNTWNSAPYTATFGLAEGGSYTLTVEFKHQQYNGNAWVDTGKNDIKSVKFRVESNNNGETEVPGVTITPAVNQKNAVNTGDATMILPFVIALVAAIAAIVVIVVYRKKRK